MISLTEEQRLAIGSRGKIIVSASAGSGKTFVMIERLVSLILQGGDVRKMLAVTFTNKAAQQMRERLRRALVEKLSVSDGAERARLKQQLSALPLADISTIHAFCSRLIRTHFYLADVDPAFRVISDEDHEGALILSRAMDEVFEHAYEEKDEDFRLLLSVYFRGKKDAKLRELVLSLYRTVRERADYLPLLKEMGREDNFAEVCAFLKEDVTERADFIASAASREEEFFLKRNPRAAEVCAQIAAAAKNLTGGTLFELALREMPPIARMPSSAKAEGETLRRLKYAGRLSAEIKEVYKSLSCYASCEEEHARYLDGQRISAALSGLLLKFDEAYSRYKGEAGVLDYADLEHLALRVLENEDVCADLRKKYHFIFVDEYQDVNPAQELLLNKLGGEEVFLVGDAKQSIYGFRGSRSEYFLNRCREYRALSLAENFRSAAGVLEAVNRVFSYAMTKESAGLDYRAAPMRGGKRYGEHDGGVFFHRVPKQKAEKAERGIYSVLTAARERTDAQAELLCRLIAEEVGKEWFDADEGLVKRLRFSDIAVLVRAVDSGTENIIAALSRNFIPVSTAACVNVCDFWEARLVIDWLSYLDNGEQDIPFAGALLSKIGGMTDEELAKIRLRCPKAYTFREACREYAAREKDEIAAKLRAFWEKADTYRRLMQVRTAAEMIGLLLSDGLEIEIAAKKDGEVRLRRIRRLTEEADGSVNAFLRRLKALGYKVKYTEGSGEDAVKVITMHSAKGLEFPSVFLVGMSDCFRGNERQEVMYTDRFLFAPKSYDVANKIARETVLRRASCIVDDRETVKGELNLLYVAMTRAKYRLHMLFGEQKGAVAPQYAERFSDFTDAAACDDYFTDDLPREEPPLPRRALAYRPDEELLKSWRAATSAVYPHRGASVLPVKSSATELLRTANERASEETSFGGGGATVEEGLAYHAFLQHVRFGESAEYELARMREEELLPKDRLALLDAGKLEKILRLPSLAALAGKRIWREQTFLLSLPAYEIPALCTGERDEIVLQGAIDLLCQEEEGYLILDYKYSSHDPARLIADYAPQIALYRKAVAKIKQVDERTVRARILNIMKLFEVEM